MTRIVHEHGYVTLGHRTWKARRSVSATGKALVRIDLRTHKTGSRKTWSAPITNPTVLASWVSDPKEDDHGQP